MGQMGLSQHMIPEHRVLLNIIRLEHEESDRIVIQGLMETEQRIIGLEKR